MSRKFDLTSLPRNPNGSILWRDCVGSKLFFEYDNIEGFVLITKYTLKTNATITIDYLESSYEIPISYLRECRMGKIIKTPLSTFLYKVGDRIEDLNRDITITGSKRLKGKKAYSYKCNRCGFKSESPHYRCGEIVEEYFIPEGSVKGGVGCGLCCYSSQRVCNGINDISTTNPEMIKYFYNKEDTLKYTKSSHSVVSVVCDRCFTVKTMKINQLQTQGISCDICGDGISYPEKIVGRLLCEVGLEYHRQVGKKHLKWIERGARYDFYLPSKNVLIEVNGLQHYKESFLRISKRARTLRQEQENDQFKKEMALTNGIKEENYVVIDCRESNIGFIKNSILNSRLADIFDLSNVDWNEVDRLSQKSLVKEVCDYWRNKSENETTKHLSEIFSVSSKTILEYLKKGTSMGWCSYNAQEECSKRSVRNGKKQKKVLRGEDIK